MPNADEAANSTYKNVKTQNKSGRRQDREGMG